MDGMTFAAQIQAVAAVGTLAAACIAAYVTWKGPERAARLAEHLRRSGEQSRIRREEQSRLLHILMNHRGRNISDTEPVNALNMINVVFHDSRNVREAYERFLGYANGAQFAQQRTEAYLDILAAMAAGLGLSDSVSRSDINRGYYPRA
jgi:uncharacterized protein DUF6680